MQQICVYVAAALLDHSPKFEVKKKRPVYSLRHNAQETLNKPAAPQARYRTGLPCLHHTLG